VTALGGFGYRVEPVVVDGPGAPLSAAHMTRLRRGRTVRLADLAPARERTIAVLGHERTGIPPEALEYLDVVVEIPMIGTGASLNVAVAGSLVLYKLAGLR